MLSKNGQNARLYSISISQRRQNHSICCNLAIISNRNVASVTSMFPVVDRKVGLATSTFPVFDCKVCGFYIPFSESAPNSGRHYIVRFIFRIFVVQATACSALCRQYVPYRMQTIRRRPYAQYRRSDEPVLSCARQYAP